MNALYRAFSPVAAVVTLFTTAAQAEPQPRIAFMSTTPVAASASADLGMRLFSFGDKTKKQKDGTRVVSSAGFYDQIVGVACSTTSETRQLDSQKIAAPRVMVRHECRQMAQPKAWERTQAAQIINPDEKSRGFALSGDNENMLQRTTLIGSDGGISFFMRAWRKADHTVCLSMGEARMAPQGIQITSISDNGCYKMTPVEFFMKRHMAMAGKPRYA